MKIDFRPTTFSRVLVGESGTLNKKVVDRLFVWEKPSKNPYNNKIMVMRQTISETKRGWLVTDMDVYDSKTGRVLKSLKRDVDENGNFNTELKYIDIYGKKQNKTVSHSAK